VIFNHRLFRTLLEDVETEYSEAVTREEFDWTRENMVDIIMLEINSSDLRVLESGIERYKKY
jgi:hypothetical protein